MIARILELSHRHKLGHLSSNLTTAEVLEAILKNDARAFILLSAGHAGLALYVALEKYCGQNAEALLKKHGTQPHLDIAAGIFCSTGSLGQGLTVAVGYALAGRAVHCIISDGECAEGCVWESLAFARQRNLNNLKVHVNVNGYCGLGAVDVEYLIARLHAFWPAVQIYRTGESLPPFLRGVAGHYHVMTDEEYASSVAPVCSGGLRPPISGHKEDASAVTDAASAVTDRRYKDDASAVADRRYRGKEQ